MNIRKQLDEIIKIREFDERGYFWSPPDEHPDEYQGEAFQDIVSELYDLKDEVNATKEFVNKATVLAKRLIDLLEHMGD